VKFRELRKKLAPLGIHWDERKGKGSHGVFVGMTVKTKIRRVFPLPRKQQKEVSRTYLISLRRAFELTAENGFNDSDFC
jgi:hypothetical protein